MLLDTDMTITNSPDASLSQVHNIIQVNLNKLMMQRQRYELHSQEQPYEKSNISSIRDNRMNYNINEKQTTIFDQRIQKALPSTASTRGNGLSSRMNFAVKGLPTQSQFNPYADENDSTSRFQLSKSSGSETSNLASKIISRSRFFGNDRTNLMQTDRQISSRSNGVNLRKDNFYTFNITNNTIRKTSGTYPGAHDQSSSSQFIQENPVMFRNYDLNDEYWLNFE